MKCNLIVPGFAKSGTSSLHAYLDQHPEIVMSSIKEPHFFAGSSRYAQGTNWHDALFAPDSSATTTKWYGECSTSYAVWRPALERIQACIPNVKFIVMLRHPIDRLLSHYRWMYALGLEKKTLRGALRDENKGGYDFDAGGRKGYYPWYLRHSRYAEYGALLIESFGSENSLFLRTESLAQSPGQVLEECWKFLDLKPVELSKNIRLNQTLDKRVIRASYLQGVAELIPKSVLDFLDPDRKFRSRIIRALGSRKLVAPDVSQADRDWLEKELAADIAFYDNVLCTETQRQILSTKN